MATNGESGPESNNESIRSLISSVKDDAQTLLKAQAELTQVELKRSASEAGGAGGLFGGALAFAGMGGIFVLITIAYVLAIWLPIWAGFGIVALLLLIAAGIFALVGKGKAEQVKGPNLAKQEWELTRQALSGQESESLPATTATDAVEAAKS